MEMNEILLKYKINIKILLHIRNKSLEYKLLNRDQSRLDISNWCENETCF